MKQLSAAEPRELLHTRKVECTGYERTDGLWEVEGRLSDVRTRDLDDSQGHAARRAGDPVHLMSLRITLDDSFTIVAAEAVMHQHPYGECAGITASYGRLVGLQIRSGFTRAVRDAFSGEQGCTHLTELLGPVATTAFQAINPAMERRREARGEPRDDPKAMPRLVGSCHGLRRGGEPAVIRWGEAAR